MDNRTIEFTIDKERLIDLVLYYFVNSKRVKALFYISSFLIPFGIILNAYINNKDDLWLSIVVSIMALIFWVFIFKKNYSKWARKSLTKKINKKGNIKEESYILSLYDDKINIENKNGEEKEEYFYNDMYKVVEDEKNIYIFTTEKTSFPISKTSFKNDDHFNSFYNLLKSKVG